MAEKVTNFQILLHKIHQLITEEGLQSGDRLPSERDLVERLQVGRSSVREALKALELLGILTTRRGEGTFLKDGSSHQLIELLAPFIIRDSHHTKQELQELLGILFEQAVRLSMERIGPQELEEMEDYLAQGRDKLKERELPLEEIKKIHHLLARAAGNSIFYRIYVQVYEFYAVVNRSRQADWTQLQQSIEYLSQIHRSISRKDAAQALLMLRKYIEHCL